MTTESKNSKSEEVIECSKIIESVDNGYIFLANEFTEKEVFARKLFGLSKKSVLCKELEKMNTSSCCFLFNLHTRVLWGMFIPTTGKSEENKVPEAFQGGFPVQVEFKTWVGPYCLKEDNFPKFLKDQSNRSMFLTETQTHDLLHRFLEHGEKPEVDPGEGWVEPTADEVAKMKNALFMRGKERADAKRAASRQKQRGRER